jgi:hypothetical protein
MKELTNEQKNILENMLFVEFKRVSHYSNSKSRNLIEIAIKSNLDGKKIEEMKTLYKGFYQNEF